GGASRLRNDKRAYAGYEGLKGSASMCFGSWRNRGGHTLASERPSLGEVVAKTMVTHTVTYFIIGLAAFWSFGYAHKFAEPEIRAMMRQPEEPLVMAGPLFQPIRGLLFGLVFYLLREPFFGARTRWRVLWFVLAVVGILGTFGPAPGSL